MINIKEMSFTQSREFEAYLQAVASLEAAARGVNTAANELFSCEHGTSEVQKELRKLSDEIRMKELKVMELCINYKTVQELAKNVEIKLKKGKTNEKCK